MRSLAILADDLTGAHDTAAPLATPSEPIHVSWRDEALSGLSRIAFDTALRRLGRGDVAAFVLLPGEIEDRTQAERREAIPIDGETFAWIVAAGESVGVPSPL